MLKFITGNKAKFREVRELLKPIRVGQLNIDLDEIQDIDPRKIIRHKLKEAFKHHKGPFIIEDSSMIMRALGGHLPGPFIKWFNNYLGLGRMARLAKATRKAEAESSVVVAFAKNLKQIVFFEGRMRGKIVPPRGNYGMGFDPIFQPSGSKRTFAQMKARGDFSKSARGITIEKLKRYLQNHNGTDRTR